MENHVIKNRFVAIFIIGIATVTAMTCVFSGSASAADRFNALTFKPVTDGGRMFTVQESKTLAQWQWNSGIAADYAYKPLSAVQNNADVNIVKRYMAQYFYGSLGLADWLSFSAGIPIAWYENFTNPDTVPPAANETGAGDIDVSLKLRILNREKNPAGLALVPFMSLPTGAEEYFLGDDGVTGGGKLIVDGAIGDKINMAANIGAMTRKHFNAYGLHFQGQFLASGAVNVKATDLISITGEVETRTAFSDFFASRRTTPTEGRAGLQWRFGRDRNVALNTGAGFGLVYGAGAPRYSLFAAISYLSPSKKERPEAPQAEKARDGVIDKIQQTVYFRFKSARLTDEAMRTLSLIADLLRENEWIEHVSIEGHTDWMGSRRYNKALAKRRADAVKKFLQYRGVNPGRMTAVGLGIVKSAPADKLHRELAKDRRVEIRVEIGKPADPHLS